MRSVLAITKALADLNRIRILCALHERGELCVCQIQELLALAPSTTSKHLSLLASAGLIEASKEGRWVWYRIAEEEEAPEDALEVVGWVCRQSAKEKAIAQDRDRLGEILEYSAEELCQRQARGLRCCSSARGTRAGARWRKAGRARSKAT